MARDVTREEFEIVKQDLEKLSIKHEVLASGLDRLTHEVAELRDDLSALRDHMDSRFDAVDSRFDRVETVQNAILAAVLKLLPAQ